MRRKGTFVGLSGAGWLSVAVFVLLSAAACSKDSSYPLAPRIGQDVEIDAGSLKPDVPRFFTYRYARKDINFFLLRTSGNTLSFLDACAKCYPKRLGYRYHDGFFICRACNEKYSVAEVEKGFGSCFPIRVEGRVHGSKYAIPAAELEKSAHRF